MCSELEQILGADSTSQMLRVARDAGDGEHFVSGEQAVRKFVYGHIEESRQIVT